MPLPPIAVFAFNRPRHLQAALEALKRSQEYAGRTFPLITFCDAPKEGGSFEGVEETREVARRYGEVIIRPRSYGFRNITEGVTALCEAYGRVIIVEDDLIVSPDFLSFMTGALEHYAEDPRVFQVSGFMYFGAQPPTPSTFFLPSSFIWGWGTWKRAWDHFSWEAPGWESFVRDRQATALYDYFGAMPFAKMLEKTMRGEWSTWDVQWMYAIYRQRGLCLYPHQSLVWNAGVGTGTHGENHVGPELGRREMYLHGDLSLEDFAHPRLDGWEYPASSLDLKAMHRLALCFQRQRGKATFLRRLKRQAKQWQVLWRGDSQAWQQQAPSSRAM